MSDWKATQLSCLFKLAVELSFDVVSWILRRAKWAKEASTLKSCHFNKTAALKPSKLKRWHIENKKFWTFFERHSGWVTHLWGGKQNVSKLIILFCDV